jgi:diaminohydroxyphosphoribosylaminopyrimidine deaminase/5-amino-6-(5-phosphoribosylamino)uracil reductase
MVGSVIVYNDRIIGEGYHQKAGEPHAEVNAINSVEDKELLKKSTLYVSLEPCSHYGKTPPCASKIIEMGIPKVVIGMLDPHDKVNGMGKKLLEDAGIEVISHVLEEECKILNKRFITFHQKKRPYIILKWAQSADGFLDKNGEPFAISNSLSNQRVHLIRATEQAILVGTQTAMSDNPSLTTRKISGRNPIRIVLDFDLKLPATHQVFNSEAPTLIINSRKNEVKENIQWISIPKENVIQDLMSVLYQQNIQSLLVEGGAYTLQQFINQGVWDEAIVITNPSLILEKGTTIPQINDYPVYVEFCRGDKWSFYENLA